MKTQLTPRLNIFCLLSNFQVSYVTLLFLISCPQAHTWSSLNTSRLTLPASFQLPSALQKHISSWGLSCLSHLSLVSSYMFSKTTFFFLWSTCADLLYIHWCYLSSVFLSHRYWSFMTMGLALFLFTIAYPADVRKGLPFMEGLPSSWNSIWRFSYIQFKLITMY